MLSNLDGAVLESKANTINTDGLENILRSMQAMGLAPGQIFTFQYFEEKLGVSRKTPSYGLAIDRLCQKLKLKGVTLRRDCTIESYKILPVSAAVTVAQRHRRKAYKQVVRAARTLLGLINNPEQFKELEKAEQVNVANAYEKLSMFSAVMRKPRTVAKAVSRSKLRPLRYNDGRVPRTRKMSSKLSKLVRAI